MSKLPQAPDLGRLRDTAPSLITVAADLRLYRIYKRGGDYPTLWNSFRRYGPLSRFDHHLTDEDNNARQQARGVLYAATDIPTAVAEFFQRNRGRINRFRHRPWLASFALSGEIQLLNLTDTFCIRAGASMKLMTGPFAHAQAWSQGFYEAYPEIQGLYYASSLTNRPTIMLYERADTTGIFPSKTSLHRALSDPLLHQPLVIVAEEIGYQLL